ncbi:MAG: ATP-binding protein [Armatimonadota bacterium]
MNEELLETLLAALQLSPENHVLRKQVMQGLLDAERWEAIPEIAEPLLRGPERAFALFSLARATAQADEMDRAREYYEEAVKLDGSLADEDFEAELEPQAPIRLPYEFSEEPADHVKPYAGPRVTFADVGGMSALKEQIRLNILYPFQYPEVYAAYGKKIGGGLLMFGPPGCGKTHIARATAGELGASFYTVELNEVLSMWVGQSEKQLSEIFDTARANAPAVIFIDEIDALGAKRSEMHSSAMRFTITQLLTEMDGIAANNQELLVLGATNEPWNVDAAFRRPGRFDRVLFVSPPDAPARAEVLRLHARGRKIDPKLPWEQIAEKTELYSGADLASLVDRASEFALSEALSTGNIRPVAMADFQKALRDMRPSTTDWLRRAKNYVTYANQDGLYNSLAQYLEASKIR